MISAYPFEQLPRVARENVGFDAALARWIAARPLGRRVEALVGAARITGAREGVLDDPYAGVCSLRIAGETIEVHGPNAAVRRIAQRVLGGPAELAAPRSLTAVEQALWALVIAAAIEDLGVAGEVWPLESMWRDTARASARELLLDVAIADAPVSVGLRVPRTLELRVPPPRRPPAWIERAMFDIPIVLGRSALSRDAVKRLAARNVITLEHVHARPFSRSAFGLADGASLTALAQAELVMFGGAVGVVIAPGAVVAEVTTGYSARSMALPDDAHVELTVGLGTTQLSLRQVVDLAIGQVVPLGRPLAGPYEIRAAGKLVGRGELVNVDGELGVRIVSLEE